MAEKKKVKSIEILYGLEFEFQHPDDPDYDNSETDSDEDCDRLEEDLVKENPELDASMRDGGGVEAITEPHPFEWYMKNKDFFKFLKIPEKHKFKGDDSTHAGMHIHVDRSIFTAKTFITFVKFLRDNKPFLLAFSNRKKRKKYANIDTTSGKTSYAFGVKSESELISQYSDPGSFAGNDCLTLNNHGDCGTIECRFFNATTRPERALANIQFVRSVAYFCKSQRDKTLPEYFTYLKDYQFRYPELIGILKEENLMTPKTLEPTAHLKSLSF